MAASTASHFQHPVAKLSHWQYKRSFLFPEHPASAGWAHEYQLDLYSNLGYQDARWKAKHS